MERMEEVLKSQVPHADIADESDFINTRIRPFMSTPLRLAATGRFRVFFKAYLAKLSQKPDGTRVPWIDMKRKIAVESIWLSYVLRFGS